MVDYFFAAVHSRAGPEPLSRPVLNAGATLCQTCHAITPDFAKESKRLGLMITMAAASPAHSNG